MATKQKRIIRPLIITIVILLVPFIAMQFNGSVRWTLSDFVIAGVLLLAAGTAYELISPKVQTRKHRVFVAAILAVVLLWLWAELAVGVFTSLGN